jgi:putative membrane protein
MKAKLLAVASGAAWLVVVQAQTSPDKAGAGPNDAQIAAIVVAANQADIDAAKVAKTRGSDKGVKEFAATMIRDHESVNKQAKDLVKKLKVKPQPSDTSRALQQGDRENLAALKKLKGAAFDKAYVDHEVAYHQQVLDAINSTLLPNAKNAELKGLIEKVTPAFQAHLEHAKQLQSQLASAGAGSGAGAGSSTGSSGK